MAKKQPKKHNDWKKTVGRAALQQWILDGRQLEELPLHIPIEIVITNFFTVMPRDVDNILKPILDGLKNTIYRDDAVVYKLTSERIDLKAKYTLNNPNAFLGNALLEAQEPKELVHIIIIWEQGGI